MEIIDISPKISQNMAVWPGDTPFRHEITMDMKKGDHLGLSYIKTTLHLGAHTDAPNHYDAEGEGIDTRSLHYYLGPAEVITVTTQPGQRIEWGDFPQEKISRAPSVI